MKIPVKTNQKIKSSKDIYRIMQNRLSLAVLFTLLLLANSGRIIGQNQKNNLLETIITNCLEACSPSDSIVYFDLHNRFDTVSKPNKVMGKHIIYLNLKIAKTVFEKSNTVKVIELADFMISDKYIWVQAILFTATYYGNSYRTHDAEFYLDMYFTFDCTSDHLVLAKKKLRTVQK